MTAAGSQSRRRTAARGSVWRRRAAAVLLRRIWLPGWVYEALPGFYICAGLLAGATTLLMERWTWLLPHAVLVAVLSVHMGVRLTLLRRRLRRLARRRRQRSPADGRGRNVAQGESTERPQ